MKSRWITHKGKRVFYGDYSNFGFDVEALRTEMEQVIKTVCSEPLHSVLVVSDVRGTKGSPQALAVLENVIRKTTPHIKRRAAIGVSSLQRAFVDMLNKLTGNVAMRTFDDLEQAKDWLVQD